MMGTTNSRLHTSLELQFEYAESSMAAEEAATLPDEWDPKASGRELFDANALREAQV